MTPLEQTLTALVHQQTAQIAELQAKLVTQRVEGLEGRLGVLEKRVDRIATNPPQRPLERPSFRDVLGPRWHVGDSDGDDPIGGGGIFGDGIFGDRP